MSKRLRARLIAPLALGIALAAMAAQPALARRIAVDTSSPAAFTNFCSVGASSCAANNFGGVFGSVYVYNDGVVSFGQPLPTTASVAGGTGSLGSAYLAPGLTDLSGSLDGMFVNAISFNQGLGEGYFDAAGHPVTGELRLDWVFGPVGSESIFELDLIDETLPIGQNPGLNPSVSDDVSALFGYGSESGGWFDGGADVEPFLPTGSVIAWNIGGQSSSTTVPASGVGTYLDASNFEIDDIHLAPATSAAVPEPATWAMMIFGFGLAGAALRRRGHAALQSA
jgi:hypothetical protein